MNSEQRELLAAFQQAGEELRDLARELTDQELERKIEEDGWTVREVIYHLVDDCEVWSLVIKKALVTPGNLVQLGGFPGNRPWAEGLKFRERAVEPGLELISAHHRYLGELLEHFGEAWDQSVRLAGEDGEVTREMTVEELLGMLTDHKREHTAELREVVSRKVD